MWYYFKPWFQQRYVSDWITAVLQQAIYDKYKQCFVTNMVKQSMHEIIIYDTVYNNSAHLIS